MIPLVFLLVGIPFLIYMVYSYRIVLNLYRYGKLQNGRLISMIPKSGLPISNIGQGVIVHYEYDCKDGARFIGESFTSDFSILSEKKKSDLIPIFVSVEREQRTCVVRKLDALRNGWNIDFE